MLRELGYLKINNSEEIIQKYPAISMFRWHNLVLDFLNSSEERAEGGWD
jgi:hypothetical protein